MVRTNRTKQALTDGRIAFGASVPVECPELIELAAIAGFDFVSIDAEHNGLDQAAIAHMIRAAESFEITPVVRVSNNPDRILQVLTSGAQGLQVPRCSSRDDFIRLVEASLFYPEGGRTFYSLGRTGDYGSGASDREWAARANRELLLIGMVETEIPDETLSAMLAIDQVNVVHIGMRDLWQSMGMPTQSAVDTTVERLIGSATAAGKRVSIQVRIDSETERRVVELAHMGVRMITVPILDFVLVGAASFVSFQRAAIDELGLDG